MLVISRLILKCFRLSLVALILVHFCLVALSYKEQTEKLRLSKKSKENFLVPRLKQICGTVMSLICHVAEWLCEICSYCLMVEVHAWSG